MKKIILTTLFIIVAMFVSISVSANGNIDVYVNGYYLESSAPVLTVADRTMVPMRDICEALGYSVEWNGDDQSILVSGGRSDNIRLSMCINTYSMNRLVKSNSPQQITLNMDVPPMLINDRTYLPIRVLSEALFFDVEWDGSTSTVYISRPEYNIGSTSGGAYSKLMMCGEPDPEKGFNYVGLMDLYGDIIIPYGPAPTYEEVFQRTDLKEIISEMDYSRLEFGKDSGWSSWDYITCAYDENNRLILHAFYALDGTVHTIEIFEYDDKGGYKRVYSRRKDLNPDYVSTKDALYLYYENGKVVK